MFPFLEKEAKVVLMQIFSLLFPIHSLSCWQGEFVKQSTASFAADDFFLFSGPYYMIQGRHFKEKLDASHS